MAYIVTHIIVAHIYTHAYSIQYIIYSCTQALHASTIT